MSTLFLAAILAAACASGYDFDARFTGRTLRFDYHHRGSAAEEHVALAALRLEGDWPGSRTRLVDDTNLGKYLFQVVDPATQAVVYSRGFASIYGEWETTGEAAETARAFPESLRFPLPEGPVQVVLKKRDARNAFREVYQVLVDPKDPAIQRAPAPKGVKVWAVLENGLPQDKVDLLLIGDGYTAAEMDKGHADARKMVELLFAQSPFKERKSDFNVWAVETPSDESGVARPSDGVHRRSALRAAYDAFGSERYVLALDNQRLLESGVKPQAVVLTEQGAQAYQARQFDRRSCFFLKQWMPLLNRDRHTITTPWR